MKLSIIAITSLLCMSSCNFKTGEPLPIKFSIFSTEYGASATYSSKGGLTMGLDADLIAAAIIDKSSGK